MDDSLKFGDTVEHSLEADVFLFRDLALESVDVEAEQRPKLLIPLDTPDIDDDFGVFADHGAHGLSDSYGGDGSVFRPNKSDYTLRLHEMASPIEFADAQTLPTLINDFG